jgi:hypothetical protein
VSSFCHGGVHLTDLVGPRPSTGGDGGHTMGGGGGIGREGEVSPLLSTRGEEKGNSPD